MSQDETMRLVRDVAMVGSLVGQYAGNDTFDAWTRVSAALRPSTQDEVGGEGGEPVGYVAADAVNDLRGGAMDRVIYRAPSRHASVPLYATPPADALRVAVDALERINAATPGSTNSDSAERALSWTHAVAAEALSEIAALKAGGVK